MEDQELSPRATDTIRGGRRAGSSRRRKRSKADEGAAATEQTSFPPIQNTRMTFEEEQEALRESGSITL